MIKSVRNVPSSSPLKFIKWSWSRGKLVWKWNQPRPVGTRIDAYGVRILFGGKSKSIRSSGAQKCTSPVGGTGSVAQSVLGWAKWCCEVLCSITVVAYMKSYYTQVQSLDALSTLLSGLRRWSDQLRVNEICRRVIFRPVALVYGAAKIHNEQNHKFLCETDLDARNCERLNYELAENSPRFERSHGGVRSTCRAEDRCDGWRQKVDK